MILLLCDENMPVASKNFLVEQGYDVDYIVGDRAGLPDKEVLSLAVETDRVIVTFDSDFGELIFKHKLKPTGVIYFRWQSFRPREPGEYLHELIESGTLIFENHITVIERGKIRQRAL